LTSARTITRLSIGPSSVEREVEDLQAAVEAAGSAFAYGFSSGAVLLLHAEDEPDGSDLGAEVAELVAAGLRRDAVEHFNRSIGVPEEMLAGLRDAPFWPTLEHAAHTLVYDSTITSSLPLDRVSAIATPVLVVTSEGVTTGCRPGGLAPRHAFERLASRAPR
jgi:hypothetical protein